MKKNSVELYENSSFENDYGLMSSKKQSFSTEDPVASTQASRKTFVGSQKHISLTIRSNYSRKNSVVSESKKRKRGISLSRSFKTRMSLLYESNDFPIPPQNSSAVESAIDS